MTDQERILVAVDDSVASERAVKFVAAVIDARGEFLVRLLHVTPAMPPGMLECGGDESPEDVAQYETEYHQWVKKTEEEAQPTFDKLRQVLIKAGVAEEFIETECYTPRPEESVARAILETAFDESFKTVVVGRSFFPWFWDVLRHHVGDDLRHKAKTYGLTIRVVQ